MFKIFPVFYEITLPEGMARVTVRDGKIVESDLPAGISAQYENKHLSLFRKGKPIPLDGLPKTKIMEKGGIRVACKIDMKSNLDGKTIHEPFYLQPQDVVFVPRSGIAKIDQWVDQHINKVVPRFFYLSYTYDILDR